LLAGVPSFGQIAFTIPLGWCAGRNPPFVQWRHSAKRATRVSRRNHRRLFALSPCRTAVSPHPTASSAT